MKSFSLIALLAFASCVNKDLEEEKLQVSTIPIKFTADIKSISTTRVFNNRFEERDSIGVFVCIQPSLITDERYADNMRFNYSTISNEFRADKGLFYPEGEVLLDLTAYCPYQEAGSEKGKSSLAVSVKKVQTESTAYSQSDFMVARSTGVKSSEPFNMSFEHCFSRVKITMIPSPDVDETMLKGKQPSISIGGFYTKANYDFCTNSFSNYSEQSTIRPYGKWEWNERLQGLEGKEAILIPQNTNASDQVITIELDGRIYYTPIPVDMELLSGKQCELEITFKPSSDELLSQVNGGIKDWGEGDKYESESENQTTRIDVLNLSFEQSNVYNVISNGRKMAEICKEYLFADNINAQAIVVYPTKTNGKADLNDGTVMQLLDGADHKSGGKISWDVDKNSLTYSEGTGQTTGCFWIMPDGGISLTKVENALSVSINSDCIRDIRGEKPQFYPIVKIATQYWMRDNLKSVIYNNGLMIPKLTSMSAGANGYLLPSGNGGHHFYTLSMETIGKLLPAGWNIPMQKEWKLLKNYLQGDAALLKTGHWIPIKGETEVSPSNNRTGFNALPVGLYVGTFYTDYEGRYVAYWTLADTGKAIAEKNFWLESNSNEMSEGGVASNKAFAIRCIRK